VRNPTYHQKCKDQQWYINQLLNTNSQQAMKIAELSSRIRSLETELQTPMDDMNSMASSTVAAGATVDESDGECTAVRNISPNCSQQLLNLDDTLETLDDSDENASENGSEGSEVRP